MVSHSLNQRAGRDAHTLPSGGASEDGEEPAISLEDLVKELNRRGMAWGFLGPADPSGRPRGLGTCMAWDLRLKGPSVTREEINEAVEVYSEERHLRKRLVALWRWYTEEDVRMEVTAAYNDLEQQKESLQGSKKEEKKQPPPKSEGKKPAPEGKKNAAAESKEKKEKEKAEHSKAEEEDKKSEDTSTSRIALVTLGQRLGDRLKGEADNAMVFVDELRRLMGDEWGGPPHFSDYENAE